jgi:outer membrane cobalamin receptor
LIPACLLLALGGEVHADGSGDAKPSDDDTALLQLSQQAGEAIEIYDERPDKPFDRDTEVRLTGEELAARGAVDLKTALALLPDVVVRESGRGGFQVDIRGARKGEVSILIDGVLVDDPYYGTFDVTTIPITDIVQIRVATTPQSPIDGPGGPGGVIEVHTRDAIGDQLVIARVTADSLPTVGVTATARVALAERLALRLSAAGLAGARDMPLPGSASIGEDRHAATGAARLEYRGSDVRAVADAFLDDRHYLQPPSDVDPDQILLVDRETTARATTKLDDRIGKLQVQAQAWVDYLHRRSRFYTDASLDTQARFEDLSALRTGAMALATQPIAKEWRWAASLDVDRDEARVDALSSISRGSVAIAELAGDVQYEHRTVRVDGAAGLAVPFGVGANPWPEAKLAIRWRALDELELATTVARKGRVPSLRERFDAMVGDPKLGPELDDFAELRAIARSGRFSIEVAPFYRRAHGLIRSMVTGAMGTAMYVNLGTIDLDGIDVIAHAQVTREVEVGAAYDYLDVSSDFSSQPLDFVPRHRAETSLRVTPNARVMAIARWRYLARQTDGAAVLPAYSVVEGSVSVQLTRDYHALARIDDLLDARPEIRNGYHAPGRVVAVIIEGTWR